MAPGPEQFHLGAGGPEASLSLVVLKSTALGKKCCPLQARGHSRPYCKLQDGILRCGHKLTFNLTAGFYLVSWESAASGKGSTQGGLRASLRGAW